jgi:hypothetical protein
LANQQATTCTTAAADIGAAVKAALEPTNDENKVDNIVTAVQTTVNNNGKRYTFK